MNESREGAGPSRPIPVFPQLPIVTPDPPRLSTREKYGSLFYLGILGLATVVALVTWFGFGVWSMRSVWTNIYRLHDETRSETERVRAAIDLAQDSRVNERQRWDICLRKPLPPLARVVLAKSLTAEAASADPRGYALTIARSPGWPNWLRVLLARPMAYAAVEGVIFPRDALAELRANSDRGVALWGSFLDAQQENLADPGLQELEQASAGQGWERDYAHLLLEAARLRESPDRQIPLLDRATDALLARHPNLHPLWASLPGTGNPAPPRRNPRG